MTELRAIAVQFISAWVIHEGIVIMMGLRPHVDELPHSSLLGLF